MQVNTFRHKFTIATSDKDDTVEIVSSSVGGGRDLVQAIQARQLPSSNALQSNALLRIDGHRRGFQPSPRAGLDCSSTWGVSIGERFAIASTPSSCPTTLYAGPIGFSSIEKSSPVFSSF